MKIRSSLPSWGILPCSNYRNVHLFICFIRLLTAFTKASHWFTLRAKLIHCKHTHSIILKLILLLFSHLRLYVPSDPFTSGSASKCIHAYDLFSMRTTLPANLIIFGWFDQTNNYWWAIQIMKLLIVQFLAFFLSFYLSIYLSFFLSFFLFSFLLSFFLSLFLWFCFFYPS